MSKPRAIDLDSIIDEAGDRIVRKPDSHATGPSDSSDSAADLGDLASDANTDRNFTGERASLDIDVEPDADLGADRIVDAEDVGLGGGLDQAEEAQLGVTDEEIEAAVREKLGLETRHPK
ncbi:MAG: hypothetical protein ABUL69_01300 [Peristeroidobacter soli]